MVGLLVRKAASASKIVVLVSKVLMDIASKIAEMMRLHKTCTAFTTTSQSVNETFSSLKLSP